MAMHALKKITVRDVMKGKPEREEVEIDGKKEMRVKQQDVCVIEGLAYDFESGKSDFGTYNRFIGTFSATRISDGEVFQSTRIIFPPIATDIAFDVFTRAKAADERAMVEFTFVVGVEYDARGGEGYRWTCKPVATGEAVDDPLARLRERTASKLAEILGASKAEALGLIAPPKMQQLEHDPKTGEVIEGKAEAKGKAKAEA